MMLDCGLSMQSVLNFLPLSFVPTNRLSNLAHWMPPDLSDPDLEGVKKLFLESNFFHTLHINIYCRN